MEWAGGWPGSGSSDMSTPINRVPAGVGAGTSDHEEHRVSGPKLFAGTSASKRHGAADAIPSDSVGQS